MSIWHYKAVLIERSPQWALFRFFPDHVMAPEVSGTFRVALDSFETEIVEPANAEALGLVSTDQGCVSALAQKIRQALTRSGELPDVEYFIA